MFDLNKFEKSLTVPLMPLTLVLLLKEGKILLAMKKRGFGAGKWNGVGGKLKGGETIEQAAIREAEEEIGVKVKKMQKAGTMKFYFPFVPEEKRWNCEVHIFACREWEGTPGESEEMRPQWFKYSQIPYGKMWSSDRFWYPLLQSGKKIKGKTAFGEKQEVIALDFG